MFTEEEAKTKWCPYMEFSHGSHGYARCLGSGCMAWRKRESTEFKLKAETEFRRTGMRLVSTEGFCGLAGQP